SGTTTSNQSRKNGLRIPRGRVISRTASFPPGRSTRASSRSPPSRSARLRTPNPTGAASKPPSANGSPSASPCPHPIPPHLPRRPLTPARRAVRPGAAPAAALRLDREVTRAAARVEHAVARPHDLANRELPPAPVKARGHDPVHHVVDRRDAVEHAAHRVGRE